MAELLPIRILHLSLPLGFYRVQIIHNQRISTPKRKRKQPVKAQMGFSTNSCQSQLPLLPTPARTTATEAAAAESTKAATSTEAASTTRESAKSAASIAAF